MNGFHDFIHRLITLQTAEVYTCVMHDIVVPAGLSALIRKKRDLPCSLSVTQMYLHLQTLDGLEGWYGPLDRWSNVTPSKLAETVRLLGSNTSIARAFEVLEPLWPQNPTSCAAVDCALWDLICRSEGLSLWRVLAREGTVLNNEPPFYGSTIGLDLEHVSVLLDVFATGYPLAKWTLNVKETIEEQLSRIRDLGIGWESIALDAHGRLNVSEVKRIHKLAPGLSWLEDPFPSKDDDKWTIASAQYSNQFPPLVVGEYIDSVERLEEMAAFPTTHAVNLEVERLGLTKSVLLIRSLKAKGRTCYLHGRALIPSSHLAIAYPDVVQWVENHLAFALERLATVHRSDSVYDACAIVSYCLEQEGIGVKPSREAGFSVSRIPL